MPVPQEAWKWNPMFHLQLLCSKERNEHMEVINWYLQVATLHEKKLTNNENNHMGELFYRVMVLKCPKIKIYLVNDF